MKKFYLNTLLDISFWSLLISNISVIYISQVQNWNLYTYLYTYWLQMIILGFFVFLRLTKIKNFYFENPVVVNGTPLASPIESRKLALRIYVFSYMAMLISYIFFIIFSNPENAWINYDFDGEYKYILTGGLIFLINHIFSYFYNINNDSEKISLDKFISVSFIRLIPMHLTLLFIGMGNSIVILLSIKTLLDCLGHTTYHDRSEIESI